ncbi:hypothetical protein A0O34_00470 [Chryseobacterium glaciei]|uniref:Uncharacterized protein n=1 Tax=Chryseobacterium glaciei TaxID=1685010 RepID=A0A172XQH5_9FLAO|nr:hypothetical protein A0O34_00470 [Chryseobacterium glaciei]
MIYTILIVQAQESDSVYVRSYPQKIRIMGNVSTSFIQLNDDKQSYAPSYPLDLGVGLERFQVKRRSISTK